MVVEFRPECKLRWVNLSQESYSNLKKIEEYLGTKENVLLEEFINQGINEMLNMIEAAEYYHSMENAKPEPDPEKDLWDFD